MVFDGGVGHLVFKHGIPMGVAHHVLEQAVTFAHRLFIAQHGVGVVRQKAKRGAVKEAAAAFGTFDPEPVHGGNEPQHAAHAAKGHLCGGFTVDADGAVAARLCPCFKLVGLVQGCQRAGDFPAQCFRASGQIIDGGAAQATAWR